MSSSALEQARRQYGFIISGYGVMPEHVHLLVSEPETALLSHAIQSLKQAVSRRLALRGKEPFWQARYYDFNVGSERKRIEKLRYPIFTRSWKGMTGSVSCTNSMTYTSPN